ncbi:MAG: type II secretion system F family protein [Candidatus Pacebacteria bacterium]|nr:type II secretion system F family protein [Candidatus Paceibacterota bacterium]
MIQYQYKAKNLQGQEISGFLEAQNERQLSQLLRGQGYFLISSQANSQMAEDETGSESKSFIFRISKMNFLGFLFGVSLTEKLFFTRNLEVMIKTGVSLVRAFDILSVQARSKRFKKTLKEISQRINKGESLSRSLSHYPQIFPVLFQETVKVGEETGKLEESLRVLSNQMEKEHNLKSKVKSAMVYPIMVLAMAFGIGIFMMIFAVPKLKESFTELGVSLPLTTKIILGFADFLTKQWILFIFVLAVLVFSLVIFFRTGKGGKVKSFLALKTPVISKITRQTNSALTLRTLSSLLGAGVPIVQSLNITAGSLGNFFFRQAMEKSAIQVEKGEKLSKALLSFKDIFSPMTIQMMEVGEETGETPQVLGKLADFLEEEVTESTQRLSSVIEPILIVFIGGAVGFFAVSMMQPMFSMMGGIK